MWSITLIFQGMVGNPASLLLAHQQLREAASQAYHQQASHLPPGLVQANKSHLHQQALANLNMRDRAEAKISQPAFPGQPPPLADNRASSQPAFPGQPPPRHSSQARPSTSSQPAFPGLQYAQQPSPQGYSHEFSPQAPSPGPGHQVTICFIE